MLFEQILAIATPWAKNRSHSSDKYGFLYRLLGKFFCILIVSNSQVLALVTDPSLFDSPAYPNDVKAKARLLLDNCQGSSIGQLSYFFYSCGSYIIFSTTKIFQDLIRILLELKSLKSTQHNILRDEMAFQVTTKI